MLVHASGVVMLTHALHMPPATRLFYMVMASGGGWRARLHLGAAALQITHARLLERGEVGDFVIRTSERGGYTLICKIGVEKLSFKHLQQLADGGIQMEGSKHALPDMNEMLRLIKPLAKRPSREIVIDAASEDTFLVR